MVEAVTSDLGIIENLAVRASRRWEAARADGLGRRLDPDFHITTVLGPYAERLASQRLSPDAVVGALADLARALLDAGVAAPRSRRGLAAVLEPVPRVSGRRGGSG